jgi:hypothetical protein
MKISRLQGKSGMVIAMLEGPSEVNFRLNWQIPIRLPVKRIIILGQIELVPVVLANGQILDDLLTSQSIGSQFPLTAIDLQARKLISCQAREINVRYLFLVREMSLQGR